MALHKSFPTSPHAILEPGIRWFPADEALREQGHEKLMPPLVHELRKEIFQWRRDGYKEATKTSRALLQWWFQTEHFIEHSDGPTTAFQFYFAQREAIETIVYLTDVVKVKDKHDLLRFDKSGRVKASMLYEEWQRYVVKMATGSGKTKVLALTLVWSYFHKLYEKDSPLARNFLVIAPNIIVLDRILTDFDGLKVFHADPMIPDNGFGGCNWNDDFQLRVHIQDDVNVTNPVGNLFVTNIHRVYESDSKTPTADDENTTDYFLGDKPVTKTSDNKVDLGQIVREVDELAVLNDEAHHIHDERLAWFKSIQDIHNRLLQKGNKLALQIDVTATPKHENGNIFPQTVCDYPLVEAIAQNVVKHPVLPDSASRAKLTEKKSSKFTEQFEDYIALGYQEWKKYYDEQIKNHKKAILFVMTDDTKNCDEVAEYLESRFPDLKDAVLTIHTNKSGDISESTTGKKKEELDRLRKEANNIDSLESPHKVIVSVLMLKEGWDVRNVTTIVGLRAYSSKSKVLPEQTLGRGLRLMYPGQELDERVSVVGTDAFVDFVESINSEGVELEYRPMGERSTPNMPLTIEVDKENPAKDIEKLDIEIPVLTPRIQREYKNLSKLDLAKFKHKKLKVQKFSEQEQREIIFHDIADGKETHRTRLDSTHIPDYQSVVGYFANTIRKELRLVSGHDILFGKVKEFIQKHLFTEKMNLEDSNVLRNLSELQASKTIIETFKKEINALTIEDKGEAEIDGYLKAGNVRPFVVKNQESIIPKKSVFNRIITDGHFELEFAAFLEQCDDIVSHVKNYFGLNFKIEYVNADGDIKNYVPDFLVKISHKEVYVIETKGREDLDDPLKVKRLKQWCDDVNAQQDKTTFKWLYVKQEDWDKYRPKNFKELVATFNK